jgi:HEAT repeat protein
MLLLASCSEQAASRAKALDLPKAQLAPRLSELRSAAAKAEAPSEDRMAELRELLETAYLSGQSSQRFAKMAKSSLLEAEDGFWILEEGLSHENSAVRSNAAYELGRIGRIASLDPLLKRLKYETDEQVLYWVVEALVALGNHAGLEQLMDLLREPATAQNAAGLAQRVLQAAGRKLDDQATFAKLVREVESVHHYWLEHGRPQGLEAEKLPANTELLDARIAARLIDLEGFQLRPVDDSRFILSRLGTRAVDQLALAVGASENYLRQHTLEVIVDLGRPGAPTYSRVLPLLDDPLVGPRAARALGAIGNPEAEPHLLQRLDSPNLELAVAVARALGPLGAASALPRLQAIVDDETAAMDLRVNAAFSVALLDPGVRFLERLRASGSYHTETLDELLDRIRRR